MCFAKGKKDENVKCIKKKEEEEEEKILRTFSKEVLASSNVGHSHDI